MSFDTLQPLRLNVDGRQPNVLSPSPFENILTLVSESEEFSKEVQQQPSSAVQCSYHFSMENNMF
jgi:hypothetical protein